MRRGSGWLLLAAFALAACSGGAEAAPEAVVTTLTSTSLPTTAAPVTVPAEVDTTAATPTTAAAVTVAPTRTEAPAPVTTPAPVETTVPPTTEPPLTLPRITVGTLPAPLPTLPAAPPPPETLPADTATDGGGGGGGGGGGSGGGLGRIEIPRLGISSGLQNGIDIPTLNRGPGHWPGTARPGQSGNVVIAGHRTSHGGIFRYINSLGAGDEIIFDGPNGRFTYVVTGTQIVPPDAMWIVGQGGGARATLFACHPPGSTAQRIVVFARLAG